MINYLSGECSGRLIKRLSALEGRPGSPDLEFFLQEYFKNKIWDLPQQQQPITVWQLSATTMTECRNMPAVLIQNAFDGMVNRCR